MTEQPGNPIAELRKAVIEQKKANLPLEPEDESLAPLHQALVAYDQLVSQEVIAALQGWDSAVREEDLATAQAAVKQSLQAPGLQSQRKLAFYQTYTARLDRMLALVSTARQEGQA